MKKLPFLIKSVLFLLFFLFYHTINVCAAEIPSELFAKSAILMDGQNQRVLFGKKETERLPMASTTKIMTCLYALEHGNLSDTVTFSSRAASAPKVHLGAAKGDQYLLSELLYSLMLESHNDSAIAIAEHISGSVEQFCKDMTKEARDFGCYDTCFETPNGLDSENHYTTCKDLAVITCHALQNEDFRKIIRETSYTIHELSSDRATTLNNKDAFLTTYPGAIGVKTGFTGNAGYCFVGAVEKEDRLLISVVLNSGGYPNRSYKWKDTTKLMNYGTENYEKKTIDLTEEKMDSIPVEDGQKSSCSVTWPKSDTLLVNQEEAVRVETSCLSKLAAPVAKNQVIGTVKIWIDEKEYRSYPIRTGSSCQKATFGFYFQKIFDQYLFLG